MRLMDRHSDPMGSLTRRQPPKWLSLTDPSAEAFEARVWRVTNAVATWGSWLPPWFQVQLLDQLGVQGKGTMKPPTCGCCL